MSSHSTFFAFHSRWRLCLFNYIFGKQVCVSSNTNPIIRKYFSSCFYVILQPNCIPNSEFVRCLFLNSEPFNRIRIIAIWSTMRSTFGTNPTNSWFQLIPITGFPYKLTIRKHVRHLYSPSLVFTGFTHHWLPCELCATKIWLRS